MNSTIIKFISSLALVLIIVSCASSSENSVKKENNPDTFLSEKNRKRLALENVIDGNVLMAKGDYSLALKKFEAALFYDTSAGICFSLAKANFYNNKLNLALQFANKAVELDSTVADYFILLSDIYNFGKQKKSAVQVLETAVEKFPDNYQLQYKLAIFLEEDRPLRAIELYEKLLKMIGSDWGLLARISDLHRRLGNINDEIITLERLLKIDPGNKSIIKNLIDLYLIQKRNSEAIVMIDELLELNPDDISSRQRKIELYLNEKNWEKVYNEIELIIDSKDLDFQSKMDIGYFFFEKSFRDSSALPISKMIFYKLDNDSSYWQVKIVLGAIAINQREDDKAIEYFKYVTENANWSVDSWVRLGALHFDNKKYYEAEKIMLEAVELFPNEYFINFILGLSLAQLGKNDSAAIYLKKSVNLNPRDVNTISAYAYTLSQLKQQDSAIIYLERALTLSPDEVNVLGTLAMIYNEKRIYEKSDSLYERALSINPDDAIINNNYAYSLSTRGLQLDRALDMVNLSLEKDSLSSAFLDTKGWILYKLGRYNEAKYFIEKAIEVGNESAVITDHLGDIEFKLGNKQKAFELWRKAFETDPSKTEIEQKIIKGEI
jgi:tetratricopeptide (TPR) repeat protein